MRTSSDTKNVDERKGVKIERKKEKERKIKGKRNRARKKERNIEGNIGNV